MTSGELRAVDRWQTFGGCVQDHAFLLLDQDNHVTEWSTGAERMLQYKTEEIVGQPGELLFTTEDRQADAPSEEIAAALRDGRAEKERWYRRQDGTVFRANGFLTVLRGDSAQVIGFAKVIRYLSSQEDVREQLERTLRECKAMRRGIHHLFKNNLQMILSLINLQADRLLDLPPMEAFENTVNRVRAIAAVHDRLGDGVDLAIVHVEPILSAIVRDVQSSFRRIGRGQIALQIHLADMALGVRDALSVGLITNELLCNAWKHAFADGRSGSVALTLSYKNAGGDGEAQLEIRDDGIGLPFDTRFETSDSLGFYLVRIMAMQLRAEVVVDTGAHGTSFKVSFPLTAE